MIEVPGVPDVETIVARLSDRSRAENPLDFPADRAAASHAGMYAWWADEEALALLGEELGATLPALIYVGQAGATRWPSGSPSKATLLSRIGRQHVRGNARSSTFRLTISTLLFKRLALGTASGGQLDESSNKKVSDWIAEHLSVAITPFPDRDRLAFVEQAVVARLDPPLNLGHCLPSSARARLTAVRRALPRRPI